MVLLRHHPGLRALAVARRCFAAVDASTLGSYATNVAIADAPTPLSNGCFGRQSYVGLLCLQLRVDLQLYVPSFA